jgi:hypothetical protein
LTPGASPTFENIERVGAATNYLQGVKLYYSGTYVYSGINIGGDANDTLQTSPNQNIAFWGGTVTGVPRRYPVTGVRVLSKVAGEQWAIGAIVWGNAQGGANGVFFKDHMVQPGMSESANPVIVTGQAGNGGIGVWGMSDFELDACNPEAYAGYGVKFWIRSQSPSTSDLRRGTATPSNEHTRYNDCDGEINPSEVFCIDFDMTGVSPDGQRTHNQRSFSQVDARGDNSQNTATGPGYPPGRATVHFLRCNYRTGTDAGGISIWGHFGTVNITDCTHNPVVGPDSRQSIVVSDDSVKGMWLNERGFPISTMTIDGYSTNVQNEEDSFIQFRGVEHMTIGTFTFTAVPNSKPIFQLFDSGSQNNGYVRFTAAGVSPDALFNYVASALGQPGWPATHARQNRINVQNSGITTPAQFQELQDGKQYTTIN